MNKNRNSAHSSLITSPVLSILTLQTTNTTQWGRNTAEHLITHSITWKCAPKGSSLSKTHRERERSSYLDIYLNHCLVTFLNEMLIKVCFCYLMWIIFSFSTRKSFAVRCLNQGNARRKWITSRNQWALRVTSLSRLFGMESWRGFIWPDLIKV